MFRSISGWFFVVAAGFMVSAPAGGQAAPSPKRPALTIPYGSSPVTLDGACDDYLDGDMETYADGGGTGRVYLKHDGQSLFVCVEATPGDFSERFAAVYLDPQGDGRTYRFADAQDYGLSVNYLNSSSLSVHGTGQSNYEPDDTIGSRWAGVSGDATAVESYEFRIDISEFNLNQRARGFGLAVYHHWFSYVGNDYGWPSNQWYDQPHTWRRVRLGE